MSVALLFALANLKRDLGLVWTWLCHRSFWQLAFGAVAVFALIQHFTIAGERRHSAKLQSQLTAVTKRLHDISTKRNEQKAETQTRIDHIKVITKAADDHAKVIESAPLPGNCKTPSAVLQADL